MKPDAPTVFVESSIVRIADLRGRLNVFAVAEDGAVWRFRQPRDEPQWLVEPLGGNAVGAPSPTFISQGLIQVWIVDPDHALWVNTENLDRDGWIGWSRAEGPPASNVTAAFDAERGTAVLIRGVDGALHVAWQREVGARLQGWRQISAAAVGEPTFLIGPAGLEALWADKDSRLLRASLKERSRARALPAPKVQGRISGAVLPDGRAIVAGRAANGTLFTIERKHGRWSRSRPLSRRSAGRFGPPRVLVLDGQNPTVVARGPGGTFWTNQLSRGGSADWLDTGAPTGGLEVPALSSGWRIAMASGAMLEALALDPTDLLRFSISIDSIHPDPVFEQDRVVVRYTLQNGTQTPGVGRVESSWDGAALRPLAPAFAPPLAAGQSFRGAFTIRPLQNASGGPHQLSLTYKAVTGVIKLPPDLGMDHVDVLDPTQFAQAHETIDVTAFSDEFETDDRPVQAGPYSCLPSTTDQQHACGRGYCGGGNTPQTCPQDCPPTSLDVRSYNSLNLCRDVSAPLIQKGTIAEVQSEVRDAARDGARLRVIGNLHTSNALLCTEGRLLATSSLKGAAPTLAEQGDFCQRFDCDKWLGDPATPVIETFEGVETVRVGPGMNLFDLQEWLDQRGLSLGYSVPGFREATVGGTIATGTHGSAPFHPSVISTRVRSLAIVAADGEVHEFSEATTATDLWKAARVSLGFLGVVVQVRLAVEPSFNLRVTTRWVSIKDLLAPGAPQSLLAGSDWGEMVWFPQQGADDAPVNVIRANRTTAIGNAENELLRPAESDDEGPAYRAVDLMQKDACNGLQSCSLENTRYETMRYYRPPFTDTECLIGGTYVGNRAPMELVEDSYRALLFLVNSLTVTLMFLPPPDCNVDNVVGKGHRMMSSKLTRKETRPFERDWEIFIPGDNVQAAIQVAKAHFKLNRICLPLIGVFLRFAPAEDGTLIAHTVKEGAFATGATGMFFEIPVFVPKGIRCGDLARYEKVYADLAEKMVSPPINGRAHWGKNRRSLFQLQRRLGTYGDNMRLFRDVVKQWDPTGMFANQFGVDIGLRWPEKSADVPPYTETQGCTPD